MFPAIVLAIPAPLCGQPPDLSLAGQIELALETAITERYERRKSSVEEALIEMYLV